eukprot:6781098-Alexandrium_andersonii.AAC.1
MSAVEWSATLRLRRWSGVGGWPLASAETAGAAAASRSAAAPPHQPRRAELPDEPLHGQQCMAHSRAPLCSSA